MKRIETTDIYNKYQKAHDYLDKKGLVRKTNKNWDMYLGDQWKGLQTGGEELPMMNVIKPIIKYKVSTIAQNNMTANFTDSKGREELNDLFKILNEKFNQSWEKAKMDDVKWQMTKNAAVQGDSYALFYSQDTNDRPQILGNTSILFGDENIDELQNQPWIIIRERLRKKDVIEIAKRNKLSDMDISAIETDNDTEDEIFNKDEVSDKVTSYLYLEKKDGVVYMTKATRTVIYQPERPFIATRKNENAGQLTMYPIVQLRWEPAPNSMRGVSGVASLIPNQIELNKTLARRAVAVRLAAFPRIAYDKTAIEDPSVLDKVGAAVGVNGGAQSISQSIAYLNATNISSDAQQLFSDLLDQTRELDGAGDTAIGNINPARMSAEAIASVREQSQTPLNEQVRLNAQFVEDVALVWFDMWTTWNVDEFRKPATNPVGVPILDEGGMPVLVPYSKAELDNIKPSVRIDVSEDNRWTKVAEQQALDNLLEKGHISFDEYVELVPENSALPTGKIKKMMERRRAMQAEMAQQQAEQQAQMEQGNMPPTTQSQNPQ
jgi:hypothetical protein